MTFFFFFFFFKVIQYLQKWIQMFCEKVGDIYFRRYLYIYSPSCRGKKKVPDNPISRHGALPAAGRLSEGGRDIVLNGLSRGVGGGRGEKRWNFLFCTAV